MKELSRLLIIPLLAFSFNVYAEASKPGDYYVSTNESFERLSPKKSGKVTNTLYKRQKVTVYELQNGWARVTRFYNGSVEGVSGQVARWVWAKDLVSTKPADEKVAKSDGELGKVLKDSDNFARHKSAFISLSQKLIDSGTCTMKDFRDSGGWMKSTTYNSGVVYFAYCGGDNLSNKVYVDVKSMKSFR